MRSLTHALLAATTAAAAVTGGAALPATAAPSVDGQSQAAAQHTFASAPTPVLTGALAPGQTVVANAGTWSPAPTRLTYTFYKFASNGYKLTLQAGPSNRYVIRNGDNTYRIKVDVTAELAGYATTTRSSATSLHVLLPQQRFLVAGYGGDWHDMYFKGSGPTPQGGQVRLPRVATHAYMAVFCSNPKPGAGFSFFPEGSDHAGDRMVIDDSTEDSSLWLDPQHRGRLASFRSECEGSWTLVVRPAASAPPLYSGVTSRGDQAFVYTGPATTRTFTSFPWAGSKYWATEWAFGRGWMENPTVYRVGDSVAGGAKQVRGAVPAGPTFLMVNSFGGGPWQIS